MKIAVFLDDKEQIIPFYSSGIIEIYSDEESEWECVNQIPLDLTVQKDLVDVQVKVQLLASEFEDCNLLVVENIKGLPLVLLQEAGIGIWKASGKFSPEMFHFVKEKLEKAIKAQEKKVVRPTLVGNEQEAEYEIDMIPLLSGDRSLNSIDILVPFIQETNFKKLQIVCSHLPKWFNKALEEFALTSKLEEMEPDVLRVTVNPIDWSDDISFRKQVHIPGMGGGCSCGG
ncbi:MAG: Nitrogenase iron-iron accessory protein AnfO [Bacteroidetes bacterium]|nr:Nitrogenase iron-iron accessory protein AnfO [Bacteroidota bacterium]